MEKYLIPTEKLKDFLFEYGYDSENGVPEYRAFVTSKNQWYKLYYTYAHKVKKGDMASIDGMPVVILSPLNGSCPIVHLLPQDVFYKSMVLYIENVINKNWKVYKVPTEECTEFIHQIHAEFNAFHNF